MRRQEQTLTGHAAIRHAGLQSWSVRQILLDVDAAQPTVPVPD